jgi:hypothetical protein
VVTLIANGCFAQVFDMGDGTVVKAFRRKRHVARPKEWTDHDRITRLLWRTEAEVYEHLQSVPDVLPYIPRYYGRVDPITLGLPQDLPKGPHLSGCGLRLDRRPGRRTRVGGGYAAPDNNGLKRAGGGRSEGSGVSCPSWGAVFLLRPCHRASRRQFKRP